MFGGSGATAGASFGGAGATAGSKSFGGGGLGSGAGAGAGFGGGGVGFGGGGTSFGGPSAASGARNDNNNLGPAFGGFNSGMGASAFGGSTASRQNVTGTTFGRDTNMGLSQSSFASDVGDHQTNCSSVKEYAYSEDKNYRYRPQMEDSK